MRFDFAGLLGVALVLSLPVLALADIPPPPPPGLEETPSLRPLPIALAGVAAALAIGLGGMGVARYLGRSSVSLAGWVGAAAVVVTAGIVAVGVARAWEDHAALKAKYDKELASWRPRGPVDRRPPTRDFREAKLGVSVFAVAPQSGFPTNLPWAALVLNRNEMPPSSNIEAMP